MSSRASSWPCRRSCSSPTSSTRSRWAERLGVPPSPGSGRGDDGQACPPSGDAEDLPGLTGAAPRQRGHRPADRLEGRARGVRVVGRREGVRRQVVPDQPPTGLGPPGRFPIPDHPYGPVGTAQVTAAPPATIATQGILAVMAIPVGLGMPAAPPPVLAPRRTTRQLNVGGVGVGSDFPVSVQSMCTTKTADVNATLQQIAELTASGCQIVRVAVPDTDDAEALPIIARKSQIPVIADIHFQPRYVFAAIDAGCAAVRVNPGNIKKFDDKVGEIARAAKDAGVPIRIGVNAGSLDKRLLQKYGKATPEALVESALWECSLFEEHDFRDIKISVKHNDPVVMVNAYRQLAARCDYPLHLGVTEAGPAFQGTIKSSVAFGALLAEGIGDTIRVSLSAPPVEEVKVGLA